MLVLLWHRGTVTVREVIDELQLDYGTVSPLLKRLEARGLVERRRRADDERSVAITLTDAGRALEGRRGEIGPVITRAFGLDEPAARRLHQTLACVLAGAKAELDLLARSKAAIP